MAQLGIYLFTGPDRDRKRQRVQELARALRIDPLDRHDTSAVHLSASTLMAWVRGHPVASPVRLVVVDEAQRLDRSCLKALEDHVEHLHQTACLILLVDGELPAQHPLTSLKDRFIVEQCAAGSAAETSQWIRRYVSMQGKQIGQDVVRDLLEIHGVDRTALEGVLDQLLGWVGSATQITQEDLRQFVPARAPSVTASTSGGRQAGGFALVEAVARRDAGSAFHAIEQQRAAGKEVVELLGLLAWQVQRWLTVSRLLQAGALREQIERIMGLQSWQLDRLVREVRSRPVEWLQRALRRCWELDLEAKTGRTIPRTALEALVMELCAPVSVSERMAGSTEWVSPVAA
ncbi:MAG: DNA polymerase III subunit delta [Candidatus Omnitrophica bacterium]|nr:DNA polymerase III subunit delta [Candidatus Omnitrophota bacterium]